MSYYIEQVWSPTSEVILGWDDAFHDLMLNDRLRMTAYREAIFEVVQPGDHVIDLGTGSGILSQWALEAGARCVTGIEMSREMLSRAIERLGAAGLGDRFVPINDLSFNVKMETPADVLISEIIGNMGDNENFQPILEDAVSRLLKPGGRAIPSAVTSYVVPVSAAAAHDNVRKGRIASLTPAYDVRNSPQGDRSASYFDLYYDCVIPRSANLAPPQSMCSYFGDWSQPPTYQRHNRYTIERSGVMTGFKAYFIAELSPTTRLDISGDDIAAGEASDSWKHAYLPLETPIPVERDDVVALDFSREYAEPGTTSFKQVYRWGGCVRRGSDLIGRFSQSTRPHKAAGERR